MTIVIDANSFTDIELRGYVPNEVRYDVVATPIQSNTGGVTEDEVIGDGQWRNYTGATQKVESQITADSFNVKYQSLDPAVATVNESTGRVTHVSNGTARIVAQSNKWGTRVSVPVSEQVEASTTGFLNYVEGSLAKAMTDFLDAYADGVNGIQLFSGSGSGTIWNPDCWLVAAEAKLSPVSFHNSANEGGGSWGGCTIVHPRFAAIADHYGAMQTVGREFTFKRPDNTDYVATVQSYTRIAFDHGLVQFAEAVPDEIGFARVLPGNWREYFPSIYGPVPSLYPLDWAVGIPGFIRRKFDRMSLQEWIQILEATTSVGPAYLVGAGPPATSPRSLYYYGGSSGDSSNGHCLVHPVDKYLIFLAATTSGNGGTSIVDYLAESNEVMDDLVPGASLTEADFSGFPTYV
jgi:hypothetical protein